MPRLVHLRTAEQEILRGDAWTLDVEIPGVGALGGSWEFRLRATRDVGESEEAGTATVQDPEARIVRVALTGVQTEALEVRDYWYSVRETTLDQTHVHGELRVANTA